MNRLHVAAVAYVAIHIIISCTSAPVVDLRAVDKLDAALVDADGQYLYLFTGGVVIQVSLKFRSEGRLAEIQTLWPGLDTTVDAAVNSTSDRSVYFFKGGYYRVFKNNVLQTSSKLQGGWPDIFHDGVEAAGNRKGKTYFFKGCNYWTPSENLGSDGYLIQDLRTLSLPCDVDATWEDGDDLVLAKGRQYWIWGSNITGPFSLSSLLDLCTWDLNTITSAPSAALPSPLICNGDARLCPLTIDEVTLPGSHNAGSGFAGPFTSPPCLYQNHDLSILEQLRFGIRYLDVDSCWDECGNNLGTCHGGFCAGFLCSMLEQIKTFLVENPTEVVMVNFNHDMTHDSDVIPELVRQIEAQLSPFLNTHFRETGQWPTLEQSVLTGKRLFVIIATQVTHMSFYPQKKWIIDETNMASTYEMMVVIQSCSLVVNSTRDKCNQLASRSLIEVSVFGGFGQCIDDMMSECDNFLFDSLEACSNQRIAANKAPNVLMVDYPALAPGHKNVLTAVRQQNARNLLAFRDKCRVRLDAATTIDVGRHSIFFSGNRVIKYSNSEKAQARNDPIASISQKLPEKIDSAISGRYWGKYNNTFFFKGCDYWILGDQSVTGPFIINQTFPGLGCSIDAAVGIGSTAYFFKGCNYWTYKRSWRVDGPTKISNLFEGLPCNIDAAFNLDDVPYFFQNNNGSGSYWLFADLEIKPAGTILDWNIDPVVCEG